MTHGPTDWNKQSDKVRDKAAQRMRGQNMADRKLGKSVYKAKVAATEEAGQIAEAMNNDDQRFVDRVLNSKSADSLIKMHDKLHRKSYYDEPNFSKSHLIGKIKKKIKNIHHFDQVRNSIKEEAAVNSVGSGNVAGLQGDPPVHMKKKKKVMMTFKRYMRK